jgi:hypothetical protein
LNKFGALILALQCASSDEEQVTRLIDYARSLEPDERAACAELLSNPPTLRRVKLSTLREHLRQNVSENLFDLSRAFVGDVTEAIALLWPHEARANRPPLLTEVSNQLVHTSAREFARLLLHWLSACDSHGRYIIIRLATGTFKNPVTAEVLRTCFDAWGLETRSRAPAITAASNQADFFAAKHHPTPGILDTVLMYVEKGRRRSDPVYCTLGIWDDALLVPIGRAPAGELSQVILDYAKAHTTKRFGPAAEVERSEATALIISVTFDDVQQSARRKAGWSLVNPRILSASRDVSLQDAASLKDLDNLLLKDRQNQGEAQP